MNNCLNCFMPVPSAGSRCPHCGYRPAEDQNYFGVLPPFTLLHDRYLIGRVLGKGGFGITYVALDMRSNYRVAVKEYMPTDYSARSGSLTVMPYSDDKSRFVFQHGKEKFVDEAKTLAKLRNDPIVVDVLDFFDENNTAYLVMEFLDGNDLKKMAKDRGGVLDPEYMKVVFLTVASSLAEIHNQGLLHRDLSPDNIFICNDGRIKLIDFGAARNYVNTQSSGMSILLKVGYAPPEQYSRTGHHGPWTDVYALCATFYTLVSGRPLTDTTMLSEQGLPTLKELGIQVSDTISAVIAKGMQPDEKKRYQNFMQLLNDIDADKVSESPPLEDPKSVRGPAKKGIWAKMVGGRTREKQPYVALVGGEQTDRRMLAINREIRIGRSEQCDLILSDDIKISRIHCVLRFDGTRIFLRDESGNGTFLANGRQRLQKGVETPIGLGTYFYLATEQHLLTVNA